MSQQNAINGLNPSEEVIDVGPTQIRFLITGADSNGSAAIFELMIPSRVTIPLPHSHDAYEETIYGQAGVSTWTVDGEPIAVGPGQALCIRRGQVHGFANHGDVDARALAIVSPAAIGPEFFRDTAAVIAAAAGGPPDRAKMAEVLRRHGLTPAPSA